MSCPGAIIVRIIQEIPKQTSNRQRKIPHRLRGALGGGGSSGAMPLPPEVVPEVAVPAPPSKSELELDVVDDPDDLGRPGMAMEKVCPSLRL
jgi:hypothetical protein